MWLFLKDRFSVFKLNKGYTKMGGNGMGNGRKWNGKWEKI
jgi:hypothetical protein